MLGKFNALILENSRKWGHAFLCCFIQWNMGHRIWKGCRQIGLQLRSFMHPTNWGICTVLHLDCSWTSELAPEVCMCSIHGIWFNENFKFAQRRSGQSKKKNEPSSMKGILILLQKVSTQVSPSQRFCLWSVSLLNDMLGMMHNRDAVSLLLQQHGITHYQTTKF